MPQFLLLAYDDTDAGALDRRLAHRDAHFATVTPMIESGEVVTGGALFGDPDKPPVGSFAVLDVASREILDAWLAREPFVVNRVWKRIDVQPVRIAARAGQVTPPPQGVP